MLDIIFTFEDKYGNTFHCKNGKITLQLKSEKRIRNIGEIVQINNLIIYKKFEDEKYIHVKTDSWSVPKQIFDKVDGIWFHTKTKNYKILISVAKNQVKYLTFKESGYESKVYIPLKYWTIKLK